MRHIYHVRREWLLSGAGEPFEQPEGKVEMVDPEKLSLHPLHALMEERNAAFGAAFSIAGMILMLNPSLHMLAASIKRIDGKYEPEHDIVRFSHLILSVELAAQISAVDDDKDARLDRPITEPLSEFGKIAKSAALEQKAMDFRQRTQVAISKDEEKQPLTVDTEIRKTADMRREFTLHRLVSDLHRLTSAPGMKAALAKHLGVPQARVSEWLNGKYIPSGDITLELLNWVAKQEEQQKSPHSV
jgi:hypothetical protein